ncbi:MAG: sigma-54-dependent Fis family transcriptional regulator [Proteobacteria bacterium]|nr:sigma-54-dependent Fis family transcriptional regulator [Pseudomonadota bacterium]
MYSILVVDDEHDLRKHIVTLLSSRGYQVDEAADGMEAAEKLAQKQYPLVLCDVRMPRMNGIELLRHVQIKEYSSTVALITAHGNIREAIDAIREGAFDYIEKPINESILIELVQKAERAYHMIFNMAYSAPVLNPGSPTEAIGKSRSMKSIFQMVERLGRVDTSVLIRGENGTGKELVARAIHFNGSRKNGPFVAVNCAAITDTLIESELFGHEKGAFTGADQRRIGKFQFASGGTLFLDEIGETTAALQVKLLRVLQDQCFTPVGSNREVKTDVRVIAATNRDLESAIKQGRFREDLFYRLNVMPIFLPPLRNRQEDIAPLVHHFIEKFNLRHSKHIDAISPEALSALEQFNWPGNIRELENAIEHAFILETSNQITFFSLPDYLRKASKRKPSITRSDSAASFEFMDWEKRKEDFEREFIIQALKRFQGRINMTADQSNIPKNTLLRKIKKYQIKPSDYGAKELSFE